MCLIAQLQDHVQWNLITPEEVYPPIRPLSVPIEVLAWQQFECFRWVHKGNLMHSSRRLAAWQRPGTCSLSCSTAACYRAVSVVQVGWWALISPLMTLPVAAHVRPRCCQWVLMAWVCALGVTR